MPVFQEFTDEKAELNNSLSLAFIGDAVFERFVRELAVSMIPGAKAHKLHKVSAAAVNCGAQAKILETVIPHLSEKELSVLRRGINAKPHSLPKNAEPEDYFKATGFEALLGYLELSGQDWRLNEILQLCLEPVSAFISNANH